MNILIITEMYASTNALIEPLKPGSFTAAVHGLWLRRKITAAVAAHTPVILKE